MIGIDLVNIDRIANLRHKDAFIKRVLTKREQHIYQQLPNQSRSDEWLAGRFAAKEAVIKVIDQPLFMKNFEVQSENHKLFVDAQNIRVHISISHERHYAVACAIRSC